jgi:hypothetical protein
MDHRTTTSSGAQKVVVIAQRERMTLEFSPMAPLGGRAVEMVT